MTASNSVEASLWLSERTPKADSTPYLSPKVAADHLQDSTPCQHMPTPTTSASPISTMTIQSTCTLPVYLGNLETTTNKSLIFDLTSLVSKRCKVTSSIISLAASTLPRWKDPRLSFLASQEHHLPSLLNWNASEPNSDICFLKCMIQRKGSNFIPPLSLCFSSTISVEEIQP